MSDSITILVIDDDPDFRNIHRSILEGEGYVVLEAENAKTGVSMAEEHKPDLILLDVMMEEIDAGFSFAEKLGAQFPIILVSSIADSSVRVFDADKLPIKDILQKPVKSNVLTDRVKKALAKV
ncbi:MAG: response regulator [Spirochaetales bacterium]|jgi:CheY-like chemotaxis protein|nr:response regulator [Spirochaetales bacterium]